MKKFTALLALTAVTFLMPCYSNAQEHNCLKCKDTCVEKFIIQNIDKYIKQVQQEWQLPGMAAAFAINGKPAYAKGVGVKELRSANGIGFSGSLASDTNITCGGYKGVVNKPGDLIDENTVFQIGSISKSFTATVIATLIDEGKLKWDDTVKNILSDFKMYDSWVTANMQLKDVMTHGTGLAGQAGTYIPNLGYSRDDVYKMIALIKPAYSFRGSYEYNNITFIIAQKIIEKVTGKSWEENVKERILEPLGMNSTSLNAQGFANSKNVATPHDYSYKGGIVTLPLYSNEQALNWLTVVGPAGSVNSSVSDMLKYAQMHNNNGWYVNNAGDTVRVMSTKAMRTLHKGVTITSQTDARTTLYAPCWFVEQNNKYRLYFHTGTTWGMTALCFYVPQFNLSGVILVNSEANSSPRYAIMRRLIDLTIGIDTLKDYSKEDFTQWYATAKKDWDKEKAEGALVADSIAKGLKLLPIIPNSEALVGKYDKDELFGDAKITLEKGELYIAIGKMGFKNKMTNIQGAKYEFRSDGHAFPIKFTMDEKGEKAIGFVVEFNYGEEKDFGGWTRK
ncbi:MAG: serine hydrolase domain-containing protein [Bacteroidales bacterium]